MIFSDSFQSPIGSIEIKATANGVCAVDFNDQKITTNPNQHTQNCKKQLAEYFNAERKEFNLLLDLTGTEFQKNTWALLQQINYAETLSYLGLAKKYGNTKAIRALASANGKNPVLIIIPCHRVIGTNNTLIGYKAGIEKKRWLLAFEKSSYQISLFN